MSIADFVEQYKKYPNILEAFVQADMINIGNWNSISEGRGFEFLTKNSGGKITKDILRNLLTNGEFDAAKIVEAAGLSKEDSYVNSNATKAEFAEKHKENYNAAKKYLEYFNTLSYVEQYEKIMNDVYSGDLSQMINNMTVYLRNDTNYIVHEINKHFPGFLE